tara:strand:- start:24484 stop:24816 length:333 start_codon:yes stop_codon:yes gene_type:complete
MNIIKYDMKEHDNKLKMIDFEHLQDYGFYCDIEEPYSGVNNMKKIIIKNNTIYENKLYIEDSDSNYKKNIPEKDSNTYFSIEQELKRERKRIALVISIFCVSAYILTFII